MSRINYSYKLIDRDTDKILSLQPSGKDARLAKSVYKAEGFDVAIVQSKYVHLIDREVR